MFFNRGVCFSFRLQFYFPFPSYIPYTMSLNPFAPEWKPGMLYNDKIVVVVARANDPAVWAPKNAWAGYGVPEQPIADLTYEESLAAVKLHPGALQMVPMEHRDYPLCIAALSSASCDVIRQYNSNGENFPLNHVPLEHRDEAMCLAAAAWCNRALWWWPPAMRNKAMYIKAAKLNPSTLKTMECPHCDDPDVIDAAAETIVAAVQCDQTCARMIAETLPLTYKPGISSFPVSAFQ